MRDKEVIFITGSGFRSRWAAVCVVCNVRGDLRPSRSTVNEALPRWLPSKEVVSAAVF